MTSAYCSSLLSSVGIACALASCSEHASSGAWTPVTTHSRSPIDPQQVLIIDEFPSGNFTKVGRFESKSPEVISLAPGNPIFVYFKQEAAAMGGNTVVIRPPRVQYKNAKGQGSRVDVIYVREDEGTHGEEDLGGSDDVVPMDEEFSRIF